jgi:hypothetical protein
MSLTGHVLTPKDISTSNLELGSMLHYSGTFSLSTDSDKEQGRTYFPILDIVENSLYILTVCTEEKPKVK